MNFSSCSGHWKNPMGTSKIHKLHGRKAENLRPGSAGSSQKDVSAQKLLCRGFFRQPLFDHSLG